jgi:hypothetical protein
MTTTFRRKIAATFLGFFYGGSVVNGVDKGIDFVLNGQTSLDWPVLAGLVIIVASGLAAFLAAYSSQALVTGLFSLVSVLLLFLAGILFTSDSDMSNLITSVIIGGAVGVGLAIYGSRMPLPIGDLENARLFGVCWTHWLWLWLPWQYVVANVVWFLNTPSLLGNATPSAWDVFRDLIKAPVLLVLLGYSVVEALNSIRQDAPWSRGRAALKFLGWFLLFPVVVNLMRIFGFL